MNDCKMFVRSFVKPHPDILEKIQGQARWAKMISPEGKLTAQVFHPTKKVNKAEELTIDI